MLSVLTFNCNKGDCFLNNIGFILLSSNADIICLQEFDQKVANSLIPYKFEDQYVFITCPLNQGWSSTVIYSKYPVIKSSYTDVKGKSRKNIMIRILFQEKLIDIISIHLDPGINNKLIRYQQFTQLMREVDINDHVIIAGDFNMRADEIPLWSEYNQSPLVDTYNSNNLCIKYSGSFSHPFDRFLYKGVKLLDIKLIGTELIGSDHYGLMCIFN